MVGSRRITAGVEFAGSHPAQPASVASQQSRALPRCTARFAPELGGSGLQLVPVSMIKLGESKLGHQTNNVANLDAKPWRGIFNLKQN